MKLLALDLLAYGPFSGLRLDLDSAETGFHMVFGGNEAGKSSALRALFALLYGVPERTDDTFRHDSAKLRVGGRLKNSEGYELAFLRRKGRKRTLLDVTGLPIDESSLERFLAGVDATRFQTVFGIDHERLAQGAKAILQGGGDVGQSLFAAGMGTASPRLVLALLDAEADGLYRPRGSKPRINKALSAYKAATKRVRDFTTSSRTWSQLHDHLHGLLEQRQNFAREQRALETEVTRLGRLQKVLPKLKRRGALITELAELEGVVPLGADFTDRRRAAEETLRQTMRAREQDESERGGRQKRANELNVPKELLQEQAVVNALHKELGGIRKAGLDATTLRARQTQLRSDAHVLLDGLRPEVPLDEVDTIRPKTGTLAQVRALAQSFQALDETPAHARRDVQRCASELDRARDSLAKLDDSREVAPLRGVVARLRRRGDVEATRREASSALSSARREAGIAIEALGLWTGTLDQAEGLAVPTTETVERFQEELLSSKRTGSDIEKELDECRRSLDDQVETIAALRLSGVVPTERELDNARERRSAGWRLVQRAWLDGEEVEAQARDYDPEQDLATSYEGSVDAADDVADRLRREADRVARYAEIEAHRARLVVELELQERAKGVWAAEAEARQTAWQQEWTPLDISPLPPREMRSWLTRHEKAIAKAMSVREASRRVASLDQDIAALRSELSSSLEALGEPSLADTDTLESSLDRAQGVVDALEKTARERETLGLEIPKQERTLEEAREVERDAKKRLASWRTDWADAITVLGLAASASPAEANAVLDKLGELFEKVDEERGFKGRIKGIKDDAQTFEGQVITLARQVAPDLEGRPIEHAIEVIHERLTAAKENAATLVELQQRIHELDITLEQGEQDRRIATQELQALCRQANCARHDELETAERRWELRRGLERRLGELEEQLAEIGGGATLNDLASAAEAVDPDTLPGHIDELRRQLSVLDGRRTDLDQEIGSERAEFARIDGTDEAADEATRAQSLLAGLRTDVDRYVRVRLASELLRLEIERYRAANQGPLLTRAGQIFATLTLGSFADLRADFDDKDEPVLVGVRSTEERVGVQGMSDGTVDQLYLSIRLATLEQYLAVHEPIPFVVDDILIRFDDERSLAALHVLAELSRKTQVLFFTHHARLVELAGQLGEGRVAVHDLSR